MRRRIVRVKLVKPKRRGNWILRWTDPFSGRPREKSAKTPIERTARTLAKDLETKLSTEDYVDERLTWTRFRERYENEHLATLSGGTRQVFLVAVKAFETLMKPKLLADVNSRSLSTFAARRRDPPGKAEDFVPPTAATIAKDVRAIRAALGWGVKIGYLEVLPRVVAPKREKGKKSIMRGRPINEGEFERMLNAVEDVRPGDAENWKAFLRAMFWGGLRLGEAMRLSWDHDAGFSIDLTGRHPQFKIFSEHHKADRDEYCPMAPEFAALMAETPEADRSGVVFAVARDFEYHWIEKVLGKIGHKSAVVVDRKKEQFAGAQSLRKAFGTRWARRVKPATLQKMMRHAHISTTMAYYVDLDAQEISDEIAKWALGGV